MKRKRKQPAKLERCVKDVKKKGGAYSPYAVCKAALKKKAKRKKKNAPKQSKFAKCVKSVKKRGGAKDPKAVCAAAGRKKYGQAEMTRRAIAGKKKAKKRKRNPQAQSDQVFKEFHGYDSSELVKVTSKMHLHTHLAALGDLEYIVIQPEGKGFGIRLEGFGGAILCSNEKRNQLFVEGGKQKVNLSQFGISTTHELVTLGKAIDIGYYTKKDHLGEDGGEAVYEHRFGTTNSNGRHVRVKMARYPDVIYRVRDEKIEFSGGSYTIRAEGIDK